MFILLCASPSIDSGQAQALLSNIDKVLILYAQMSYQICVQINGFEWDGGNWPKCGKHGVGQAEIEHVLTYATLRVRDPNPEEERYRTAGQGPKRTLCFCCLHLPQERKCHDD